MNPRRVLLLGATGTIGRATAHALIARGHDVVCFVRTRDEREQPPRPDDPATLFEGSDVRLGDVTRATSIADDAIRGERFDALISCLASRTGVPDDAWAIDYRANSLALQAAKAAGIPHMVLLSAICVQRPLLGFQNAKLAFEDELMRSGLTYSIVRPTAFFKSLSGQLERLRRGKPYLMFGDGRLTACKPISDGDLAQYIVDCLNDETRMNRILPIGGPGPAITPLEQGEHLFSLLGREAKFKRLPVSLLTTIAKALSTFGRVSPGLAKKAELARIGHYYATQSMLVLDPETGTYDAGLTPETGAETLFDFYASLVSGKTSLERGDHSVF